MLTPYEGNRPYAFVSYAHKDTDRVIPILNELSDRGYRLWYDDGIAPGSEWPEYIASHLNASEVVIAFVSPSSIESANCRREVTFALAKKKKFIGVILEETEMSLGMEMQLSAQQCVMKYSYRNDGDFYRKLCGAPDLEPCLEEKTLKEALPEAEAQAPGKAEEALRTQDSPRKEGPAVISDEDMHAVKHMQDLTEEKKAGEEKKEKKAEKEKKERKSGKRLLIVSGAIAALILLIVLLNALSSFSLPDGEKVKKGASVVTITGQTVSEELLARIGKMKKLGSLRLEDCELEGSLASLKNLADITTLSLRGTKAGDLSFLPALTSLYQLDLTGNEEFTDVSLIPAGHLNTLVLTGTGVSDVSALAFCESLRELSLADTKVKCIDAFSSLRLESLDLSGLTELTDLSAFEGLAKLRTLNLARTGVTSVPWLSGNAETLTSLDISGTEMDEAFWEAVGSCRKLSVFRMNGVKRDDLSALAGLTELTVLRASNCGLRDVSALSGMTKLKSLWLNDNRLTSIDLRQASALTALNLMGNGIIDLSGLPAEHGSSWYLILCGNPADLTTLPKWEKSNYSLAADYSEALLDKAGLPSFTRYYVTGIPIDKQVALEDIYYSSVRSVTEDELREMIESSDSLDYGNWKE